MTSVFNVSYKDARLAFFSGPPQIMNTKKYWIRNDRPRYIWGQSLYAVTLDSISFSVFTKFSCSPHGFTKIEFRIFQAITLNLTDFLYLFCFYFFLKGIWLEKFIKNWNSFFVKICGE